MAEFILGRIKFVYRNNWADATDYVVDDVVTKGGKTYICISNHTSSSDFGTDYDPNPAISKWNLLADGQQWRSNWAASTDYNAGDLVKYGGLVYQCNTSHTSATYTSPTWLGLEQNQSSWDVFATSFDWKDTWATSTRYKVNDVVVYSGYTYVCITKHISASTAADGLELDQAKWQVFNAGIKYLGDWEDNGSSYRYKLNDLVKYGADLWICTTAHTSSSSFDDTKWSVFLNGFQFENSWSDSTTYQSGDIVTYGGYSYVAKQNHTGKKPTAEPAYWDVYTTGFSFEGDWNHTTTYKIGSVVRNHGYTYLSVLDAPSISTTATATTVSTDPTNPNTITADTTGIVPGMAVYFGSSFGGIVANTQYYVLSSGFSSTRFKISATEGGSPVTLTTTSGQSVSVVASPEPGNITYWTVLNTGLNWTNNAQSYTGVIGTVQGSSVGVGASFNITRTGTIYTVSVANGGNYFVVGDQIKILGSSLGGITPANDLLITVSSVSSGVITAVTHTGISVTWTSGTVYVLGDIVFFGASSYVCVEEHVGSTGTRPDNDTTATYWNLLTAGSEIATLTTAGDTLYYGPSGPSRLPIGADGQVLRVKNGYPSWETYGHVFNAVYVGPTGQDLPYPQAGFSIDQPWKSIRFACKQIEEGYLNPEAKRILQTNKAFLIKEVYNYLEYTYQVPVTGTSGGAFLVADTSMLNLKMPITFKSQTGSLTLNGSSFSSSTTYYIKSITSNTSFTVSSTPTGATLVGAGTGTAIAKFEYDQSKAKRDAALVVEGLIYDISRGGNLKTTNNTLAFYDPTGTGYITTNTELQITQFIDSHQYLKTIIQDILNNTAPTANYQVLNGDSDPVLQVIDTDYTAESAASTKVLELLDILIDGLTQGDTSTTQLAKTPNTTISVKTGTYVEVLPVLVPEYTALVGDELRSTVVQPKSGNDILINDQPKTKSSLERIKSILPNILSNTPVSASTGNTATQEFLFTASDNTATASITSNTAAMVNILVDGNTSAPSYVLPTPTGGTGNAYTAGYFNGARLVYANRQFIMDELAAYMAASQADTWNGLTTAQKDACTRDIGLIVDALRYDLTYGGNLATVIAARSYYSKGVFVEQSGEKAAALAAQNYLKSFIDNIVQATGSWGQIHVGSQDTSGTAGSLAAANFAVARVQEIYDCINTGTTPTTITPDITWPSSSLLTANTAISNAKTTIQAETQEWIKDAYPRLAYDTTLCDRDISYIIDALRYDMMFGSNFLSIWSAESYNRSLDSTTYVLSTQFEAEIGMIGYLSAAIKELTSEGTSGSAGSFLAVRRVESAAKTVYNIINTGFSAVPSIQFTNPTGYNTSTLTNTAYASTGYPTGDTSNFGDGKAQIVQNYDFIVADVLQYYANGSYGSVWSSTTTEGRDKGKRDIKYILDALQHDMTYGGNYQALVAGSAYYSSYLLNISDAEKPAFIDLFGFMKTLIGKIVRKDSITAQSGNTVTRVSTGTAGSAAAGAFAEDRLQNVIDWITNGTAPTAVAPYYGWASTALQTSYAAVQAKRSEIASDASSWVQKYYQEVVLDLTLTERDAGLVVDAIAYDMVLGTNFNALSAGRRYLSGTTSTEALLNGPEKDPTLGAIDFIKFKTKNIAAYGAVATTQSILTDIINKTSSNFTPKLALPEPILPAGSYSAVSGTNVVGSGSSATFNFVRTAAGFTASVNAAGTGYSANDQIKILGSNIGGATPANDITVLVTSVSSGGITGVKVLTAREAVVLLEDNRDFIISEVIAYLDYTYPDFTYDKAKCSADVGYVVDAVGYDLMFGSNFASVKAGMAYYRGSASLAVGAQKTATLASYAYLKTLLIDAVSTNATAVSSVTANMDEIIDIITNGLGSANAFSLPTPTGGTGNAYTAGYFNGARLVNANRAFIIAEMTAWINVQKAGNISPFVSGFTYDVTKCERDVGYIVDALRYDLTYGGNLQTTVAARSYFNGVTANYGSGEKEETLATYAYLKTIIDDIAQGSAIVKSSGNAATQDTSGTGGSIAAGNFAADRVQEIYDTINNSGTLASAITPDTSWVDSDLVTQFTTLQSTRSRFQSDVITYIDETNTALIYDKDLAVRDAGYILDAVHYDLIYGGDSASQQAGQAYYSFGTSEISSYVKTGTLAAINRLNTVAQSVIQNNAVTATTGNVKTQVFKNGAQLQGSSLTATTINSLVTKIYNYVNSGLTSGAPSITVTTIATGDTFTSNSHGLANGDYIENLGATANGVTSGTRYYVVSASTNTFKLATTYGGTALTSFTNGTGLTLSLHYTNNPYTGWVDSGLVTQYSTLSTSRSTLQAAVVSYIDTNYPNLTYDSSLASRDAGLAIDAASFDLMFNSNFRGVKGAQSYARPQSANLLKGVLAKATRESLKYLYEQVTDTISANDTAVTRAEKSLSYVIDYLAGKSVDEDTEMHGTVTYNLNPGVIRGIEILRSNVSFLAEESSAWVSTKFGGKAISTSSSGNLITTLDPHNLVVGDPVKFSFTEYTVVVSASSATTDRFTINDSTGLEIGMPVVFSGSLIGGVVASTTYYISSITGNEIAISTSNNGASLTLTTGSGVMTATVGGVMGGVSASSTYYVLSAPSITTLTITETQFSSTAVTLTDSIGSCRIGYAYDETSCKRDMTEFVNALVYDAQYTGNWKSKRAAVLYFNAIKGSKTSDMWHVRNGTGIRNMTMNGLEGTLSVPNAFGTRRPEAGSYTSLDPGFGPNDSNAWVNNRSCYVQNCTLFGTGATALKIDGALHSGGNRSIVANDYTTFISDGIGTWCTGSDSLTELVSVFAYYSYSGYIAELGGKIRATNGNSSYGTYGVLAEGVDTYETPIYGTLNNRGSEAYITNVMTDGADEVLRIEFANAGSAYTNAEWTVSGSGYNVTAVGDEFRDYGVTETRLIDLNDGYGYGGTGYLTAANAAQVSTTGSILLAASDTQLSTAYVGMRVLVTAGTGAGQSAAILTYNSGSKEAKIYKESFTNLTVTGTNLTTDRLTVASTVTLYANMPIYLGSAIGGASANTLYYVKTIASSTEFTISTSSGGATFDITSTTSGQTVTLYAAGWDHVVPGKTVYDALDLTTTYIVEPRITYTAPGYTATSRTLPSTATWQAISYAAGRFVAVASGSTSTATSTNGTTWSAAGNLTSSTTWVDVAYGGGEGATATAVVGGLGGIGGSLQAVITGGQVTAVNVIAGGYGYLTAPTVKFSSGLASATAIVKDGAIVAVNVDIPGSGYITAPTVSVRTDIITSFTINTAGKNYTSAPTVTVSGGGSSNQATGTAVVNTNNGIASITVGNSGGTGYTSQPTVTIVDSNAKFVAIPTTASGGSTKGAYQTVAGAAAGNAWTATTGSLPNGTYASITYGAGYWVAVGGTATGSRTTDADTTWNSVTLPTLGAGTYSSVAYGQGVFIAVSTGNNATAISTTSGSTWAAGTSLPASANWSSIAYGNGRFVAIASGSTNAAVSVDAGTTWVASSAGLPASVSWNKVTYGQGLFVAVAAGTTSCATSTDGLTWTLQTMPASSNWKSIAFGSPNSSPIFAAISSTSGTVAASIRSGATAKGRVKVASNTVTEIRMIEPGSGYPHGSVTATTTSTNVITTSDTTNLIDQQPVEFTGLDAYGLTTNVTYYVIGSTIVANTSFKVSATAGTGVSVNLTTGTGLTGTYTAGPIATQTDPNKTRTAPTRVRLTTGALGNPTFTNRGSLNTTATATVTGDGYSDLYQASNFINVSGLFETPKAGANVEFSSIPGTWFKLVAVNNKLGSAGNYSATFQINPALSVLNAPAHGDQITTRLAYSQVRLTGHDFLYVGTGNYSDTNYPFVDPSTSIIGNQTYSSNGGRVFFTSTDQDGNFNVGNLFGVQQSTGTATLNASAFNLSGLQSLQLGTVSVGAGSAIITSFSTDPYFTANSDNILPTQKAVKSYITAQIGGGQSSLNVNTLTSGVIYVANNTISTTSGVQINVRSKMYFQGGIDGAPVALAYFMQR